ncbi:MAG: glycosyltransferase family 39 protein [Xenococcaceae cyanobacterium MO_167.B27]|nr:glycosyltransferase family 39 protein [Xenococcaceae cyanobacterium MO_167.B27]
MEILKRWWHSPIKYSHIYGIFSVIWLLIVSWIVFLWHLGSTSLVDETEPLFAEAARQMTVTGNWITPYFNEETRFDKPPLTYWLMAVGYKLIGVNEWAVRLPSAIAGIALIILGFYTLRYFGFTNFNSKDGSEAKKQRQLWVAAWIGSALMGLNLQTIIWGRTGVSDMLLSGCMGSALFCFFLGYTSEKKNNQLIFNNLSAVINEQLELPNKWYLLFYILTGLAVLAKGPVGIVLPGLIIFCFLVYVNQFWSVVREIKLLWGLAIFLVITVPWYVLVILENGQAYINSFFGYHNFERFTDVVNGHDAPWYFYFIIVLALFAPWSVYLPLGIMRSRWWQYNHWRKQPRQYHLKIFAFWWFVCIFVFFSISVTKLPSYVLPLIPAAAILVALLWSDAINQAQSIKPKIDRGLLISVIANLLLALLLAIAFYVSPNFIGHDPAIPKLSRVVAATGLTVRGAVVWGLMGVAIAFCLTKIKYWGWAIVANLMGFLLFISLVLVPVSFFVDTHRQLPLREIAQDINQFHQPDELIFMVGFKKPSLVFYSHKPILFFRKKSRYKEYWDSNKDTIQSETSLVIGREKELRKIAKLQPEDYQQLSQHSVYKLVRINNRPKFMSKPTGKL